MVIDMIYDYVVKHNGKYYKAGEEVPEKEEPLSFHDTAEISDEDITLETDAVAETKSTGKRGRPKKTD